jgi:crotonobetainyl-CoA:carnitine CoA-transferase CaiB-like acyl-CoA transferase
VACLTQSETLITKDGELAPYACLDRAQTGTGPLHRIYEASDGWVAVAARGPAQAEVLCGAFGAASTEDLESAARTRTTAELIERLAAGGLPAELVLLDPVLDKLFDDPGHKASQVVVGYQHAECGLIEHPGAYWKFSDADLRLANPLPPPLLGEHTGQILSELGYSAGEIAEFRKNGVVAGP